MATFFESFDWAARSEPADVPKPHDALFWAYGTAWGTACGRGPLTSGPGFGAAEWAHR